MSETTGERTDLLAPVMTVLRVALRLVIPVAALLAVYLVAYVNLETYITWFDAFGPEHWYLNPGYWLTAGHLILPLAFLVSNLTNRRYGESLAYAQLFTTWAIIGVLVYGVVTWLDGTMPASPLPPRRESLAFLFAIIFGQMIGIFVFDRTRGRTWWGAPLFSALWGQTAFVLLYYSLVYVGLAEPWVNYMLTDLALKIAAAVLMLVPYQILRRLVRPLPGYGGA